ncbi:hypothetical protein BH10BAC1_BH10BAC1_05220 [soil metagenome]
MVRKIIFGLVIASILIGGIYWFFYTKEARTPISEGINAIPIDAAIIFESKQSKNTWKKLSQTNIMWEELLGTKTIARLNQQATSIDSALQIAPEIAQLLDNHSVFISAHSNSQNDFDLLFVYSLPNLTYKSSVENYLKEKIQYKKTPITATEFEGEAITTINTNKSSQIYYAIAQGILIISKSQKLIESSIHQLKSGFSLAKDKNFSKIINTSGKNVDANVYINYKKLPSLITPALFSQKEQTFESLLNFAACSSWDISIKPNALTLSGFTSASDSSNSFLSLFSKQKPQEAEVIKIIPSTTASFLFLGMSNVTAYHQDYKKYLIGKNRFAEYDKFIKNINSKYKIDIEKMMLSWMDNEMALVVTEPNSNDLTNNSYAIIRSNNIEEAINTLTALSETVAPDSKTDSSNYKGNSIRMLNISNLLGNLLGQQFSNIKNNYFTSIDNYIVFADSHEALIAFIEANDSHKTLSNDKNYKSFSENISAESNIYLYNSIARSKNVYNAFIKDELAKEIETKEVILKKFEAVGMQFSSNNKLFYSNIYLKYNPEQKQQAGTLWEAKLDTTVTSKPYLLINHKTKAKEVFVQDDANKIYLISNTGKTIWTKQLPEKIMSDVFQIDVLKNDKLQMIFNTRSSIYMFDRNGNLMDGFPIKLRSPATNAISVVDYEKNRDYRIFIATENKRIVCYNANGDQITGFAFDKTDEQVFVPLQYFIANSKDHLCAIDMKGKIYIMDRKGGIKVNMKEQMEQGIRNFYIEPGKDYNKTYLIAADTLGNIIKISLTNHKESIKIQDFETSPYFDWKDINNDKTKEFIFLTRNELKVFSADKSLLFKYEFESKISQTPLFFTFPDGTGKIGVSSEESNELFLFNENGSLFNSFPINGKTGFSIGDLNNEGNYNLVTGSSENSIFVYQLK